MTTYLHIGLQKTGTTYLQRSMNLGREELASHGVIYPDPALGLEGAKAGHGHHFLSHALMDRRVGYTPDADFSLLPQHVAALKHAIAEQPGATGVISSEVFSTLRPSAIKQLRELFPEDDVRIVVYLRRQDAWIDSLYGQMIKVGRRSAIEQFVEQERHRLDYRALLKPWSDIFEKQRIIVRTYEYPQGTELWDDFMATIGVPEASKLKPKLESANDSLAPELAIFTRSLHRYGQRRPMRRLMEKLAPYFPSDRGLKYLREHDAGELMETVAESNAAVASRYLGRKRLFKDLDPLPFVGADELTAEQYAAILGGICLVLLERIDELESRSAAGQLRKVKNLLS